MIKGSCTSFLLLFSIALHGLNSEHPLFKNIWSKIGPIETKLNAKKSQLKTVEGQNFFLINKIKEQEETLNNLAEQQNILQNQFKKAKTEFEKADSALHNIKDAVSKKEQKEYEHAHIQRRAKQKYKLINNSVTQKKNKWKEYQEVIGYAEKNKLEAERELQHLIQNQREPKKSIEQQQKTSQQILDDLVQKTNQLKEQDKTIKEELYLLQNKDYREAKKKAHYEEYKLTKKLPDLAELYEPQIESTAPRSFLQELLQKPQSWYRSYAQHVRKKEVEAIQKGESLSKQRTAIAPSFVPRLTQKEDTKRKQELAKRMPIQGANALFESEQTNLNWDKKLHLDNNVAKEAFDSVRTWYSNWKTTGKQITPVFTKHPELMQLINFN